MFGQICYLISVFVPSGGNKILVVLNFPHSRFAHLLSSQSPGRNLKSMMR